MLDMVINSVRHLFVNSYNQITLSLCDKECLMTT